MESVWLSDLVASGALGYTVQANSRRRMPGSFLRSANEVGYAVSTPQDLGQIRQFRAAQALPQVGDDGTREAPAVPDSELLRRDAAHFAGPIDDLLQCGWWNKSRRKR